MHEDLLKKLDDFISKTNSMKDKFGGHQTNYNNKDAGSSIERQAESGKSHKNDEEMFDWGAFTGGKGASKKPRTWTFKELADRTHEYIDKAKFKESPEKFDFSPDPDPDVERKRREKNWKRTQQRQFKNKELGDKIEARLREELSKPNGSFSNVRRELGIPETNKNIEKAAPKGFWGGKSKNEWAESSTERAALKENKRPEEKENWKDFLGGGPHRRVSGGDRTFKSDDEKHPRARPPINEIWPNGKPMKTAGKGYIPDKDHPKNIKKGQERLDPEITAWLRHTATPQQRNDFMSGKPQQPWDKKTGKPINKELIDKIDNFIAKAGIPKSMRIPPLDEPRLPEGTKVGNKIYRHGQLLPIKNTKSGKAADYNIKKESNQTPF